MSTTPRPHLRTFSPALSIFGCLLFGGWLSFGSPSLGAVQLVRVAADGPEEMAEVLRAIPEAGDCGTEMGDGFLQFPLEGGRLEDLRRFGFDVEVIDPDLEASTRARFRGSSDFGAYHTYAEAIDAMDALAAAYPDLMSPKESAGTSVEGRDIWVYKISDQPWLDEDEPEVFFNSYIHAREAITFEVLLGLAEHLLTHYGADPRITELVNEREIFFMPVVNPDGVEYNRSVAPEGGGLWRKNRRSNGDGTWGVDLNRNFGFQWGYDDTGSSSNPATSTYRGRRPFSEPETRAIWRFAASRKLAIVVNYHSYGAYELLPWGYERLHTEDDDLLFAIGRSKAEVSGYRPGTSNELTYAVNGSANDWFYGAHGIPTLVTEVGQSFWPPEDQIPSLVAENLEGNLRIIDYADPLRVYPPLAQTVLTPLSVPSDFTLDWHDPGVAGANPARSWNLYRIPWSSVETETVEPGATEKFEAVGWNFTSFDSYSPPFSFGSNSYVQQNATLTTRRGYTVQAGDRLTFMTRFDLDEGRDYAYLEVSTDGRHFASVPGNLTTDENPFALNRGNGITGTSGNEWVQAVFPLKTFLGETVWFRFRLRHGGTGSWFVDDLYPVVEFPTKTTVATGLTESQYTFTHHPHGEFGFVVEAVDAQGHVSYENAPRTVYVGGSGAARFVPPEQDWGGLHFVGENPVRSSARLRFVIPSGAPAGAPIELQVHDVRGRAVGPSLRGRVGQSTGELALDRLHVNSWSDRLTAGATVDVGIGIGDVPSGVYFAALRVGNDQSRQRLLVVR